MNPEPAAGPSLDALLAHPEQVRSLSPANRSAVLTQLGALALMLAAEPLVETCSARADTVDILTTAQLAERWQMPEATIRDLCRTGKLPAKKLGEKHWVIGVAALKDWLPKTPLANALSLTLRSCRYETTRDPRPTDPPRSYAISVRRGSRSASDQRGEVGSGDLGHVGDDQETLGATRRRRASQAPPPPPEGEVTHP